MSLAFLPYRTGTVTIPNSSSSVTGIGTLWLANVLPGDELHIGQSQWTVASVESNTALTIQETFTGYETTAGVWTPGAISSGVAYKITKGPGWGDSSAVNARLAKVLDSLQIGYLMQSATALAIATGTKVFTVGSELPIGVGARLRAASAANPTTHYMEGVVTAFVGTALTLSVDLTAGSGSRSDWVINFSGQRGATGGTNLLTTKGDVFTHDGANPARLPVGTAGQILAVDLAQSTGLKWIVGRETLTAARTYYVRTDGNNSNTGLVDSAGGAFLTLQKAIDTVATLDLNGNNVTIQVGAGTYTAGITLSAPWVGAGTVTVVGDNTTPTNCVISTSGFCVSLNGYGTRLAITGFKFTSSSTICLAAWSGASLIYGSCDFGTAGGAHVDVRGGGVAACSGNYTISGGAQRHWYFFGAVYVDIRTRTITLTGTPNFTAAFVEVQSASAALLSSNTFSGAATGKRYSVTLNGAINVGGGDTYFPGDVAGTTATGGQYA